MSVDGETGSALGGAQGARTLPCLRLWAGPRRASCAYQHCWDSPTLQDDTFLEKKKRSLFWGQAEEENERMQQTGSQTSRGDV